MRYTLSFDDEGATQKRIQSILKCIGTLTRLPEKKCLIKTALSFMGCFVMLVTVIPDLCTLNEKKKTKETRLIFYMALVYRLVLSDAASPRINDSRDQSGPRE